MAISNLYPAEGPTLNLNFTNSRTLDRRITFERTTTGTYMGRDGLIKTAAADEPRFDHRYQNGQVESLGLLIEEGTTNLVNYSTYFASDSSPRWRNYFPATATITTGIDAPDGTNTAVRLTCNNTGNSLLRVEFDAFTPNGTDTYTASFYVRKISGTTANGNELTCDLHDGSPSTNYLPQLVTNQWVRIVVSGVPSNSLKSFFDLLSDRRNDYVLDFWGLQIEQKSFATSYMPSSGIQGSRGKDIPTISGSNFTDWYNPTEGSIFVKYSMKGSYATDGFNRIFEISDGGNQNRFTALLRGINSDIYEGWGITGVGNVDFNTVFINFNEFYTWAAGFKYNDYQRYAKDRNGNIDGLTDESLLINNFNPTELNIGYEAIGDNRQLNGHISQLVYYPTRLTNEQLQNLIK